MTEAARSVDFGFGGRAAPPARPFAAPNRPIPVPAPAHAVPAQRVPATTPAKPARPPGGGHLARLAIAEGSVPHREAARACRRRALLLWPRLDRSRLARTGGDPWRIARLVAGRTPRSLEEIVAMLTHGTLACPVVPARAHRPLSEGTPLIPRR